MERCYRALLFLAFIGIAIGLAGMILEQRLVVVGGCAEAIAAMIARPMYLLSVLAAPVVRLLSISTEAVRLFLGMRQSTESEVSEEAIRILVEQGAQAGAIEEAERDMVERIFRLGDRPLKSLMTPRPEIVWLDVNGPEQQNREFAKLSNHSRFPVCDGDLDHDVKPFPGEGTYHTLGGFIIYMLGEVPATGQMVEWSGFRFEIMDMDGYRVDKVLVELLP